MIKSLFSNKEPIGDPELLSRYIQTGDLKVLGELYAKYIHLVYGVCLKYLKNREDSKDAINKIFEKIIIDIPKFEIRNFKSWLYVVVKNYCLMELRKKNTEMNRHQKYSDHIFMESTDISHPIDEVDNDDLEKRLLACLEKLKQNQYDCIKLFYYENKCYKEISEELELDINKVKSYIQNGKRNLKICLDNKN